MEPVTSKLKRTRLFAHLPDEAIADLIEQPGIKKGGAGDKVSVRQGDLVVLLEGGLAMGSDNGGEHIAAFSVDEDAPDPAILYTIPAHARLQLTDPRSISWSTASVSTTCCPTSRRARASPRSTTPRASASPA